MQGGGREDGLHCSSAVTVAVTDKSQWQQTEALAQCKHAAEEAEQMASTA